MIDQIEEWVLSIDNVQRLVESPLLRMRGSKTGLRRKAIEAAIKDNDAKLRRCEEAPERGLLSIKEAAERIKGLRQDRATLLETKASWNSDSGSRSEIRPIPASMLILKKCGNG